MGKKKEKGDSPKKRDWLAIWMAGPALAIAIITFFQGQADRASQRSAQETTLRLEVDAVLYEAWDALGGQPFTDLIIHLTTERTNSNTLRQVYQQADQETMLRVVLEGGTLREAQ